MALRSCSHPQTKVSVAGWRADQAVIPAPFTIVFTVHMARGRSELLVSARQILVISRQSWATEEDETMTTTSDPAVDTEAGTVTTEQALSLLLFDKPADLKQLEREGAFQQITPGRYWLKDLVQGFVRHARRTKDITDTQTLSSCFGLTGARIGQLASMGWFKAIERGKFNWIDACGGYIRFLRDEDRKTSKSAADSRIRDARAREIEVRTQQRLSRLVPLEIYEEMIDSFASVVRSEFAGLPAACTRDLTMRRIIEREVNARLRRIAEHAMAQAIRLETVRGPDDAVRADGAGSVGGGEQDVPGNGSGARPT
jgi:hypothetical protein